MPASNRLSCASRSAGSSRPARRSHRTGRRAVVSAATGTVLALLATGGLSACGSSDSNSASPSSSGGAASPGAAGENPYHLLTPGVLLASTGSQPPFVVSKGSEFSGYIVDITNEVAKRLGLKVTYKSTTVTAGLQSLSSGQLDMVASGLGVTTERQQVVSFGKGLYWSTTAVVTKKGAGSADLGGYSGKKVGVVTGAVQEKFVTDKMKGAVKTNFQALGAAVSQLNSGTVDAAVMGGPDAEEYLKQFPDLEIAASAPVDHETTVAFQKSNDALVKAWDKTVTDMVNDGTLKKMYNTYFTEAPNAQLLKIWPGLK